LKLPRGIGFNVVAQTIVETTDSNTTSIEELKAQVIEQVRIEASLLIVF
jgi:hypothetical protein